MTEAAPLIDKRRYEELLADAEALLQLYSDWLPNGDQLDAGAALARIFARMAERVVERINQIPDKNLLAFLDMVGLQIKPPQPARVPLTFNLVAKSTADAVVPANTQVAAVLGEEETEPVVFETTRELTVTRTELVAAYAREPAEDRFADYTETATGQKSEAVAVFSGQKTILHALYLSHDLYRVAAKKDITVYFQLGNAKAEWLWKLVWKVWDGSDWVTTPSQINAPTLSGDYGDYWSISLQDVAGVEVANVNGKSGYWIRAQLSIPLQRDPKMTAADRMTQSDLSLSAAVFDSAVSSLSYPLYPFGQLTGCSECYLACEPAFAKPGAELTIRVNVNADQPAQPSGDLQLQWDYWDGTSYQPLGASSSISESILSSDFDFNDGSRAFTQDGIVTFTVPPTWARREIQGMEQYWLKISITMGDFGTGAEFQPPILDQVEISYEWLLPVLNQIASSIEIRNSETNDSKLLPELTFTNQQAVDFSKTFYPFGEKPALGDAFYLKCDAALMDKPNASVTLDFTFDTNSLAGPSTEPLLVLEWEYWNGADKRWQSLGVTDKTGNFVTSETVTFDRPVEMASCKVNGEAGYWIRVRIAQGNYGVEAHYEPTGDYYPETKVPIYQLIPASFHPPIVHKLEISFTYTSAIAALDYVISENDFAWEDHSDSAADPSHSFLPFTLTEERYPAIYLGFQREGDESGFDNTANTLYFSIAEQLYDAAVAGSRAVAERPWLQWDYWNGERWKELGVEDETDQLSSRGMVHFIGPQDFRASSEFGVTAFWLRVRWIRGAWSIRPMLKRVLTKTVWAEHTVTLTGEVLGASNGEPNQTFQITRTPILTGQVLEVKEPEQPSALEREPLLLEEGDDAVRVETDEGGTITAVWVRWHQVADFYQSGPRSRHYVVDRITGQVCFGDGKRGLIPPIGRSNIRMASYQTGGGLSGNRNIGTVVQLKSTIPFVGSVTNWESAGGGAPRETLDSVKRRGPKVLRHRDRAVAIADYEDLAFEASTNVARAKGIPADSAANAGQAGLIVVPNSTDAKPIPSVELLQRVEDHIRDRLSPMVDLWVVGPDWLEVSVYVQVVPTSVEKATGVKAAVLSTLASFLHPLTGGLNGEGWSFGRKPYRSDLYASIENIDTVDHVRRLIVEESGEVEAERFLVFSGTHEVELVSNTPSSSGGTL